MPTVLRWASQKPEFAEQYRLACQVRETNWFEELREIADDSEGDYIQVDGRRVFNGENVQRSKLKIETIRWMLAKMSPRKFGDRQTTEIVGDISVTEHLAAKEIGPALVGERALSGSG